MKSRAAVFWQHLRGHASPPPTPDPAPGPRGHWRWDYPPAGAPLRGRTLLIDGWASDWPPGRLVVAASGDRVLAASAARHPRPDVAAALDLDDPFVGFHLEADLTAVPGDRLSVALRVPVGPDEGTETREFALADEHGLPYEGFFRDAEARGRPLGRAEIYRSGFPTPAVLPDILSVVRRYARGTVLDVGCGVGAYRLALRDEPGVVVHSLEYDAASAVAARRNGVNVIRGDARALPVRDRAVGTVIAIELLEHVDDPERAVAELARVARLNAIVTVPNAGVIPQLYPWGVVPWHLMERTHVSFFSACTLEALLRTGFAHVQVGYGARSFGFPGAPPLYDHLVGLAAHGPDDLRPAGRPRR